MAIWQFDLQLKKRSSGNWTKAEVEKALLSIDNELIEEKSWSKNIRIFGKETSTCILIFLKENIVIEVEVRLDLRNLTSAVFNKIIQFIDKLNAMIVLDNNEKIMASESLIREAIKESNAIKVVKDPEGFLKSLD